MGFYKLDKKIMENVKDDFSADSFTINVKTNSHEQIFSSFNYDKNDTLNSELSDYILKNIHLAKTNQEVIIKLYTSSSVNKKEVENAIKAHYTREYVEAKEDMKKASEISLVSLGLGLLSLALLVLCHHIYDNFYFTTVIEIMAWVFVWEAVDKFFFTRFSIRTKCKKLQKIYFAKIEIVSKSR